MIKYTIKKIDGDTVLSTEDKFEFYSFVLMNRKEPYYAFAEIFKRNKCLYKTVGIDLNGLSWFVVDVSKLFIEKKATVETLN